MPPSQEENDPELTPHPRGVKRICKEIEQANSQETLILASSQGIELDDDETDAICSKIKTNKRIKHVRVESLMVTPSGAEKIAHSACLSHPTINKLVLPLWSVVNTPSQKTVMHLKGSLEDSVENHNLTVKTDNAAYKAFKKLDKQKNNYTLPSEIYIKHIRPFLVGHKKKLILEP